MAADLDAAFLGYDAQRAGSGHEFLDAVEHVIHALLESPRRYRAVYRDTRRAHVRRFPYGVFYRVVGGDGRFGRVLPRKAEPPSMEWPAMIANKPMQRNGYADR